MGSGWADQRDARRLRPSRRARDRRAAAKRFAWSDGDAVRSIVEPCGLALGTTHGELEIRAASPEAYVDGGREHPVSIDAWPMLERAGVLDSLREEMIHELAAANEGAPGLLIRSPYVVHELRRSPEPD